MTCYSRVDFDGDSDNDADTGIFKRIFLPITVPERSYVLYSWRGLRSSSVSILVIKNH